MTVDKKPFSNELIDALLGDYKKPEDLVGENGLLKQLTKALVERALQAEMTDHLGHSKNQLLPMRQATLAMDAVKRPSKAILVPYRSTFYATGLALSNRSSLPNIKHAGRDLTIKFYRSLPVV
jgi:hypothetical protein